MLYWILWNIARKIDNSHDLNSIRKRKEIKKK